MASVVSARVLLGALQPLQLLLHFRETRAQLCLCIAAVPTVRPQFRHCNQSISSLSIASVRVDPLIAEPSRHMKFELCSSVVIICRRTL